MKWVFTSDEFMHVWEETCLDRYPVPLDVRSSVGTRDEYDALRADASRRFPLGGDADLSVALRIVANPSVRVTVSGNQGNQRIRILGCTVGTTDVLVTQTPGPTPEYGADVSMSLGQESSLPSRIVAALGSLREGRRQPMTETLERICDTRIPILASLTAKPVAGQIRRLLNKQRDSSGYIAVDDALGATAHYVSWIDVSGDGRYLIRHGDDVTVLPCSETALAAEIAGMWRQVG